MDLGQALAAARRHWILLLVLTIIGLGTGAANQLLTSPTYRSTVTVFFSLNRGGTVSELANGSSYVQDLVPSYAKVATTPIVLAPVISDLGLSTTPGRLANKIKVVLQPASVVIQIAATDTDPDVAAKIANGVGDQLSQALATLSPRTSSDTSVITVTTLSPATASNFPISPNRTKNLGAGLLGGLILGVIAVAVRESVVTQPLTTRTDIERVTDIPVIAAIVADPKSGNRPLPVSTHPTIARSDSFRMLQTTLEGLRGDDPQCFVVVSSLSGEGRTTSAVNLAIAMAHASHRVLLIDADLRKPSIAQLLGIATDKGLTSILNVTSTLEESTSSWTTQPWGSITLDVIPAGPIVTNPSELLASRAMSWLLETVRDNYDVVILDSPALLQHTDGALLSGQLDFTLMIVDAPRTKQRHLVDSLARLRMAGADVLGLVLNRTAPATQAEYPVVQPVSTHAAGPAHAPTGDRPDPAAKPEEAAWASLTTGSPSRSAADGGTRPGLTPPRPGNPSRPGTAARTSEAPTRQVPVVRPATGGSKAPDERAAANKKSPPTQGLPIIKTSSDDPERRL
jgi:succinoglycan biosynthesis transport protein ExoP